MGDHYKDGRAFTLPYKDGRAAARPAKKEGGQVPPLRRKSVQAAEDESREGRPRHQSKKRGRAQVPLLRRIAVTAACATNTAAYATVFGSREFIRGSDRRTMLPACLPLTLNI
jgi:hypothetical protein